MGRRLLAIASLISLLMCVALLTMWVRSYRTCISLEGTGWIKSWEGEIEFVKMQEFSAPFEPGERGAFGDVTPEPPKPMHWKVHAVGGLMKEPTAFGFGFTHGTHFFAQDDKFYESTWDCYLIPYWLPVAIAAILPVVWVQSRRWQRRKSAKRAFTVATSGAAGGEGPVGEDPSAP